MRISVLDMGRPMEPMRSVPSSGFMLAQGLQPARDLHVVHDGGFIKEYWHAARSSGRFYAGGWPFAYTDLRRFRN